MPITCMTPLTTITEVNYLNDFKDPYNSTTNPDPALLDFFTYNSAPVRSGIVSLNTRQPPVLAAILQGAIYRNSYSSVVSNSDAITAANSIVKTNYAAVWLALSRADIASLSSGVVSNTPFTNTATQDTKKPSRGRSLKWCRRARGVYSSTWSRRRATTAQRHRSCGLRGGRGKTLLASYRHRSLRRNDSRSTA